MPSTRRFPFSPFAPDGTPNPAQIRGPGRLLRKSLARRPQGPGSPKACAPRRLGDASRSGWPAPPQARIAGAGVHHRVYSRLSTVHARRPRRPGLRGLLQGGSHGANGCSPPRGDAGRRSVRCCPQTINILWTNAQSPPHLLSRAREAHHNGRLHTHPDRMPAGVVARFPSVACVRKAACSQVGQRGSVCRMRCVPQARVASCARI